MQKLIRWFNVALIVGTLLIYTSSSFDPSKWWASAFFGLFWPFAILGNLIMMVFWVYRKKWYGLISFICLLAVWPGVQRVIGFNSSTASTEQSNAIHLVTFNVQDFSGLNTSGSSIAGSIEDYFQEKDIQADVYCFQEGGNKDWAAITKALGGSKRWISDNGNTAILTNLKVVGKGSLGFGKTSNSCIYLDLKAGEQVFRVYNVHFQSNKISQKANQVVEEKRYNDKQLVKSILARYRKAVILRSAQVKKLRQHIDQCPYPVMVCGDFNDQPMSYVYKHLMDSGKLQDGFVERGSGIGTTYNGVIPALRIDYILADKQFEQLEYKRLKPTFSDHFAIFSTVQVE